MQSKNKKTRLYSVFIKSQKTASPLIYGFYESARDLAIFRQKVSSYYVIGFSAIYCFFHKTKGFEDQFIPPKRDIFN